MLVNDVASSAQADPRARRRRTVRLIARVVIGLQIFLVCGGWVFRATLYWRIAAAPGDPYGFGDLVELLIYFVLRGTSAVGLGIAVVCAVVPTFRCWRSIGALVCAGVLAAPLFLAVHPHVPQLMKLPPPSHADNG